jgi:hypothetical protein
MSLKLSWTFAISDCFIFHIHIHKMFSKASCVCECVKRNRRRKISKCVFNDMSIALLPKDLPQKDKKTLYKCVN